MFANVKQPIYGLMYWNDVYKYGDCCVQFYRTRLRRDKATAQRENGGFYIHAFEVVLPKEPVLQKGG